MIRRPAVAVLTAVLTASGALLAGLPAASAGQPAQTSVVTSVPTAGTPQIQDGAVFAITQVGSTMVVGGNFTKTQPAGSTTVSPTPFILAFDAATGAVNRQFLPNLDGSVQTLLPGPTAGTVYVGGEFNNVRGVPAKALVLLRLSDGSLDPGFTMPPTNGTVQTVKRVGSRLYVGGTFTKVDGQAHGGLVTLNASTGTLDPYLTSNVAINHNWTPSSPSKAAKGAVGVFRLDITPDNTKMVAIGNFKQVDGTVHDQIAMWDLPGAGSATLRAWNTTRLGPACLAGAYDTYARDVSFSPDGTYFSLVNTGGATPGSLCDSASRWETSAAGPNVQPSWVAYTGRDSLLSTTVTGEAVYVGGHQRWLNNGLGLDKPGPGAVPRPGVAALDPATGLPLAWNPGRHPRGAGTYALYATPSGLWMGSDTNYIGVNKQYTRSKIAFFPLAGGQPAAAKTVATLPGGTYLGTVPTPAPSGVLYRVNAGGPVLQSIDAGPDWAADTQTSRSAYREYGTTASAYGTTVAKVDATVPAGTPQAVFSADRSDKGSKGDGQEMQWHFPAAAGQSVDVRLYFANRCTCTAAVGSQTFDVSVDGVTRASSVDIVATAGDQTGTMRSWNVTTDSNGIDITFTHEQGNPIVSGLEVVPHGAPGPYPTAAGALTGRGFDGTDVGAPQAVGARLDVASVRGAMLVGGSLFYGKTDTNLYRRTVSGGTWGAETLVDPYNDPVWSNVNTGSGNLYRGTKPGFYNELTNVTSMFYDGTGRMYYTLYKQTGLYYRAFNPDSGVVHHDRFQVPGVSLPDLTGAFLSGGTLFYATRVDGNLTKVGFDGTGLVGTPTVVSGPGRDGVDWRGRVLYLGPAPAAPPAATVAFRGSSSFLSSSATTLPVPVPSQARVGDALLLKVSTSGDNSNPQAPGGWSEVARQVAGSALTVVWQRVATAQDLTDGTVPVALAGPIKSSSQILAYSGTAAVTPVSAAASAGDVNLTTTHSAPAVDVPASGSWVVWFWTDKSSATTGWSVPTDVQVRAEVYPGNPGTGYLTTVAGDEGSALPAGRMPTRTATTDAASKAAMVSVVLAPASS